MKKLVLIFALAIVVSTGAFAQRPDGWGLGLVGRSNFAWDGFGHTSWWGLSLKAPQFPLYWGIHMRLQSDLFGLSVVGDYYLLEQNLVPDVNFGLFLGLGANVSFISYSNDTSVFLGGRIPVGVYFMPVDFFEIFLNIAPTLGLHINPNSFPEGFLGFDFGVRFWF